MQLQDTTLLIMLGARAAPRCSEILRRTRKLQVEPNNYSSKSINFHENRQTGEDWLAIAHVYPEQIEKFIWHSKIVLTMEAYGHLIPDTESSAVMAQGNVITGGQKGAAIWSASGH